MVRASTWSLVAWRPWGGGTEADGQTPPSLGPEHTAPSPRTQRKWGAFFPFPSPPLPRILKQCQTHTECGQSGHTSLGDAVRVSPAVPVMSFGAREPPKGHGCLLPCLLSPSLGRPWVPRGPRGLGPGPAAGSAVEEACVSGRVWYSLSRGRRSCSLATMRPPGGWRPQGAALRKPGGHAGCAHDLQAPLPPVQGRHRDQPMFKPCT